MTPRGEREGKPKPLERLRWSVENGLRCGEQCKQVFEAEPFFLIRKMSWGCTGFDAVIGRSGLRVRALFSLINEQTKLNDNKVVSMADFRAQRLAA